MHGREFNGNLKRHLEALLENAKVGFECGKIFAALKKFNAMRQKCIGKSSIPPVEILYYLLRESTKAPEFQLHLKFMQSSSTYLS